jgi:Gpi18-like mannosyltransferase
MAPIEMSSHAISETLFTFLIIASVFSLIMHWKTNHQTIIIWAGITWALATLCRPVGLYLSVIYHSGLLLYFQ